jgi:uncharacterized repeat protein (TIGR01451 family)
MKKQSSLLRILLSIILVSQSVLLANERNSTFLETYFILVEKIAPKLVSIDEEFTWNYKVHSKVSTKEITLTDFIPEGMQYVSSSPQAQVLDRQLIWVFSDMQQAQHQSITVTLKAIGEGNLLSCFTAEAIPQACLNTSIGKAEISITKTGTERTLLGSEVNYFITVKNQGTHLAKNVVIEDPVPDGLRDRSGKQVLTYDIGDLGSGESKQVLMNLTAVKRGKIRNQVVATSSNAKSVSAEAYTLILKPDLTLKKTGDTEKIVGQKAKYNILVSNRGDITLENVIVEDTAPKGTRIISAPGANVNGNRAIWMINSLEPESEANLQITLTGNRKGVLCNKVSAQGPYGLFETTEACTDWEGISAMVLEFIDTKDALLVGESTQYLVTVTNQGFGEDTNIVITVELPNGLKAISFDGPTKWSILENKVVFAPYAVLEPNETIEYKISVMTEKTGNYFVKAAVTSDTHKTPIAENESTTVY